MINTKHIYTVATLNGFSHQDVKDYISFEWNRDSTKDLTPIEYNQLINYLDKKENDMADKIFAKGLIGKAPREGAPDFVVGSISIKCDEFVAFLNEHASEKGWVNLDINKQKADPTKLSVSLYKPIAKDGF